MLRIRPPQLFVFDGEAVQQYADGVVAHLAARYPREHTERGDEGLRRLVHVAIDKGAQHDIRGRGSVLVFAELLLEFGEAFELSPDQAWAHTILKHPRLPGSVKVHVLAERLRARTGGRKIVKIVVGQSQE